MFIRDQDGKSDLQIALDDFVDIGIHNYTEEEVIEILSDAIYDLKGKVCLYEILLEGLEKRIEERNKRIDEEIEQVWSKK